MTPPTRPGAAPSGTAPAWHHLSAEEAVAALESDATTGLATQAVTARRSEYGPNRLPDAPRPSPLRRLLNQFNNPLILVLIAAGVVTALLRDYIDSAVIFGVVIINALIGFIQEGKAESALDAVRAMLANRATVIRDGERHDVDSADLVPGDVVLLESGDRVPADLRLLRVHNTLIEESALTGESVAVDKSVAAAEARASLADRTCLAYSGTLVVYGQARGVVIATGERTEVGQIGAMVGEAPDLATPLTKRLDQFALQITAFILVVGLAAFTFAWLVRDLPALDSFLAVVGLAVAAIPEGLPAIITIVLALGTRRMAMSRAIVRRLPAVETLGSVTVICSDKTGTLTRNEMTAVHVLLPEADIEVSGAGYAPEGGFSIDGRPVDPADHDGLRHLAESVALCNDARLTHNGDWAVVGDPTEGALLTLAMKAGLERAALATEVPRLDEIPFESENRYMATLHHDHHGRRFVVLKGAPEELLSLCHGEDVDRWHRRLEVSAAGGERVLAVARSAVSPHVDSLNADNLPADFDLVGMVGLLDPPREEAVAAVQECQRAGVAVKMITGDHAVTAAAIGSELGLRSAMALTGESIEAMDDRELLAAAETHDVIARASPRHKMRLVEALQASGNYVAMTGDGANDAPALKAADIGVAMGHRGTDAAKEASDLVLTDDNFATIAKAVTEGRVVYDNIKKSLLFILPTNGGQSGLILVALLLGLTLPVTVAQILWVNMVTAVTLALALAFEPAEPGVMSQPPRPPRQPLITRALLIRVLFVSLLMTSIALIAFEWELGRGASLDTARTTAVNALVFGEILYLFHARHFTRSAFTRETFVGNPVALLVSGILIVLQMLFVYAPPMQSLFTTTALDGWSWLVIIALSVAMFLAVSLEKAVLRSRGVDRL